MKSSARERFLNSKIRAISAGRVIRTAKTPRQRPQIVSSGFHLFPLAEAFDHHLTTSDWFKREVNPQQQTSCLVNKGLIDSLAGGLARMGLTFTISKQITNENNQ